MIKRKKMISLLLVLTLVSGMFVQTYATEIDDTKKKAEELESKKKAAENEKTSLADQLKKLTGEMEETKKKISAKEDEITNKEEELILAKADENEQYESMKKRIRYMYENGNTGFVEILCSSKSIGELLNNAEYISRISGYDRNMLVEFQKVVTNVENQEAELKKEYKELQTMQDDLITKQDSVNELIKNKQSEIQSLTSELGDTKNKLAQLEAAAAEAERKQKEAAAAAAAAKKAQAAAKKNRRKQRRAYREGEAAAGRPSSRLQFSEADRAVPELQGAIRKSDKAADRLDAARDAIPNKSPGKPHANPLSRPIQEAGAAIHGKVREVEQENSGVQSGHLGERGIEKAVGYGNRRVQNWRAERKLKPWKDAAKAEQAAVKANADFYYLHCRWAGW